MIPRFGVAPGTLTVNLDGAGNFGLGLVDPYSRHLTSIFPYEGQPVRPQFTVMPDGRVIPTAAPFMSASSWQGGEPYRSAALAKGIVKGPLAGALGADDLYTDGTSVVRSSMAVVIATGLAAIAGGIGGAALATPSGHKPNAAGGAGLGSLIGPVGSMVGAMVGAGEGNRLRAGGGAAIGALVAGIAAALIARAVVK